MTTQQIADHFHELAQKGNGTKFMTNSTVLTLKHRTQLIQLDFHRSKGMTEILKKGRGVEATIVKPCHEWIYSAPQVAGRYFFLYGLLMGPSKVPARKQMDDYCALREGREDCKEQFFY